MREVPGQQFGALGRRGRRRKRRLRAGAEPSNRQVVRLAGAGTGLEKNGGGGGATVRAACSDDDVHDGEG
jgi:hypothetical protein